MTEKPTSFRLDIMGFHDTSPGALAALRPVELARVRQVVPAVWGIQWQRMVIESPQVLGLWDPSKSHRILVGGSQPI